MTIEEVTVYRTADGKLHDCIEDAELHIVRSLENSIGGIVDGINRALKPNHTIGTRAKSEIVFALVGNLENARNLQKILDKFLQG